MIMMYCIIKLIMTMIFAAFCGYGAYLLVDKIEERRSR